MSTSSYYVPPQSKLPFYTSAALFALIIGLTLVLNTDATVVPFVIAAIALACVIVLSYVWFATVVNESRTNLHSEQMDRSYRWGMFWFITTEVLFFGAFFATLFHTRLVSLPWLAGELGREYNTIIWEQFVYTWPLLSNPDNSLFQGPKQVIDPLGLPLVNTILLVSSSFTVSFAHHALKAGHRSKVAWWMLASIIMGIIFLFFQGEEYFEAYQHYGLTLNSGIYGSTFFILTGFHGLHVTLGTIMLTVILIRVLRGHFTPEKHFGFEAVSWYWHFVDVVWIGLFIFVYLI